MFEKGEFGNKRESHHFSPTEKTLPSANKLGHHIANIDVKYIQTPAAGEKVVTETFMIQEREELLKQHYQLDMQMKELKKNWHGMKMSMKVVNISVINFFSYFRSLPVDLELHIPQQRGPAPQCRVCSKWSSLFTEIIVIIFDLKQ